MADSHQAATLPLESRDSTLAGNQGVAGEEQDSRLVNVGPWETREMALEGRPYGLIDDSSSSSLLVLALTKSNEKQFVQIQRYITLRLFCIDPFSQMSAGWEVIEHGK